MEKTIEEQKNLIMNMQRIAQEKQDMTVDLVTKNMKETHFPKEKLPKRWIELTGKSMRGTMPFTIKAGLLDFAEAYLVTSAKKEIDISLTEFQVMANSFDTATPLALGLDPSEYHHFIKELMESIAVWKKMYSEIEKNAVLEAERVYKMKETALGIKNPLQAVKAEA